MSSTQRLLKPSAFALTFLALAGGVVGGMGMRTLAPSVSLAQPAETTSPAIRIARVDVYKVTERLMLQEPTTKEIEAAAGPWRDKLKAVQDDLAKITEQLKVLPQSDPSFQTLLQQGRAKEAEGQQMEAQGNNEVEALRTKLLIDSYDRVVQAAEIVAKRDGFSHVLAARSAKVRIDTTSVGIALQEMLARPVLAGPAEDDITEAVAKELEVDLTGPAVLPGGSSPTPGGESSPK